MFDVFLGLAEEVVRHHLALIVLYVSIAPDALDPDPNVHELAVYPPVLPLCLASDLHRHQVRLPRAQLAKDYHARA